LFQAFIGADEGIPESLSSGTSKLCDLIRRLIDIQTDLFRNNSEMAPLVRYAEQCVEVPDDLDLDEFWPSLDKLQNQFYNVANPIMDKWNQRTRLNTAGAGQLKVINQSTVIQINNVLTDKDRLVQRTQLKRKRIDVLGKEKLPEPEHGADIPEEYDPEIFDDGDFYQQMLRTLIESGLAGGEGDAMDSVAFAKQLAHAQKKLLKKRRKVDTKASKGRKLSFKVQPKLENFMFPQPVELPTITDELFRHVFEA